MKKWIKKNVNVLVGIGSITIILVVCGRYLETLGFLAGVLYGTLFK